MKNSELYSPACPDEREGLPDAEGGARWRVI